MMHRGMRRLTEVPPSAFATDKTEPDVGKENTSKKYGFMLHVIIKYKNMGGIAHGKIRCFLYNI